MKNLSKIYEIKYKDCEKNNKLITIKKGLHLYRSTLYDIERDKDKFDNNYIPLSINDVETEKEGVYFAVINPTISEFMTLEYNKDMYLYTYQLTENIEVNCGKYSDVNKSPNHLDINIRPISLNYDLEKLPKSYELFISKKDLDKIKFIKKDFITIKQIKEKYKEYCLNISKEDYIDYVLNTTINSFNVFIESEDIFMEKYKILNVKIYNVEEKNEEILYDTILTLYNIENNDYELKVYHEHFYPQ